MAQPLVPCHDTAMGEMTDTPRAAIAGAPNPFQFTPRPPDWRLDWDAMVAAFPWLRALRGCPQDPAWHREGDVLVHTRLVVEALAAAPAWRVLPAGERETLFAAALLHDVAKPASLHGDPAGRVSTRGHAGRGEVAARQILWRLGVPAARREAVCQLVRHHQVPFFAHRRADRARLAILVSQTVRCDRLALLAEADAQGHVCPDQATLFEGIAAFREDAAAQRCLDRPRAFASDQARFLYCRDAAADPDAPPPPPGPGRAILVCGLPGSGREAWRRATLENWPLVAQPDPLLTNGGGWDGHAGAGTAVACTAAGASTAADACTAAGAATAGAGAADGMSAHAGPADRTFDMPRAYLRAGIPFVWFGTFLTRRQRAAALAVIAEQAARVRIVHVEASEERLYRLNHGRARPLPLLDLRRLLDAWEVPDRTEAHAVDWLEG